MSIDLQRFCACGHDLREYIRKPWTHKGYLYATNGHVCIRLPAPDHPEAATGVPIAESALGLFERATNTDYAPLPAFERGPVCYRCEGEGRYKQSKCGDCEEGWIKHGRHEYECKECDGVGWVPDDEGEERDCEECWGIGYERRSVDFGDGVFYDARYLAWVKELPGAMFARGDKAHTEKARPAHFIFTGGEGLLMPMLGD